VCRRSSADRPGRGMALISAAEESFLQGKGMETRSIPLFEPYRALSVAVSGGPAPPESAAGTAAPEIARRAAEARSGVAGLAEGATSELAETAGTKAATSELALPAYEADSASSDSEEGARPEPRLDECSTEHSCHIRGIDEVKLDLGDPPTLLDSRLGVGWRLGLRRDFFADSDVENVLLDTIRQRHRGRSGFQKTLQRRSKPNVCQGGGDRALYRRIDRVVRARGLEEQLERVTDVRVLEVEVDALRHDLARRRLNI
jgi:hypothetical protein